MELNTSWYSKNLSFLMLKSKFNSMKTVILFSIFAFFGNFLPKNERKCWFSSKLQKSTERVTYLLLFWRLFTKGLLEFYCILTINGTCAMNLKAYCMDRFKKSKQQHYKYLIYTDHHVHACGNMWCRQKSEFRPCHASVISAKHNCSPVLSVRYIGHSVQNYL